MNILLLIVAIKLKCYSLRTSDYEWAWIYLYTSLCSPSAFSIPSCIHFKFVKHAGGTWWTPIFMSMPYNYCRSRESYYIIRDKWNYWINIKLSLKKISYFNTFRSLHCNHRCEHKWNTRLNRFVLYFSLHFRFLKS